MNTRSLAADILTQVISDGKSLTKALETGLEKVPGKDDRSFIQALCFGVLRWYFRLEKVLNLLVRKPVSDEGIRILALMGLYQLRYMRVKPYAAVAETVAAAGRKSWAKPFLNGVLRNYQRSSKQIESEIDTNLLVATAHPLWLVEKLQKAWPENWKTILEQNNIQAPMSLRVNHLKSTTAQYLALLEQAGIAAQPDALCGDGIRLENPVNVDQLPGFDQGVVSVQDSAAQLAATLLNLQQGQRVLEIGAAPGGKTLHILESSENLVELVAVDVDPERQIRTRSNLDRAGLNATLIAGDAGRPEEWWDGKLFDRILVDAPCSATGVIRRHPDIKLLRKPTDIPPLVALQKNILNSIWGLLAPGGILVYATCSVLQEENAMQMAAFLAAHENAKEIPINANWGVACQPGRQILTGELGMDGFYYARVEKTCP